MGWLRDLGRGIGRVAGNIKDEAGRVGKKKVLGVSLGGALGSASGIAGLNMLGSRAAGVNPLDDLQAGARNAPLVVGGVGALGAAGAPGFASTVSGGLPAVGTTASSAGAAGGLSPISAGVGGVPTSVLGTMPQVPGLLRGALGKVGGLIRDYPGAISGALNEFGSGGDLNRAQTRALNERTNESAEDRARRARQDAAMEPLRKALMLSISGQVGQSRPAPAANPYQR